MTNGPDRLVWPDRWIECNKREREIASECGDIASPYLLAIFVVKTFFFFNHQGIRLERCQTTGSAKIGSLHNSLFFLKLPHLLIAIDGWPSRING